MKNLTWIVGLTAALALAPACGDDDDGGTIDAPPTGDIDAPPTGDIDAPPTGVDAPPVAVSCEAYCTAVTTNCTDDNEQYAYGAMGTPMENCMAYCDSGIWEDGEYMVAANTVGCRQYHATAAASDPATHCGHAGPTGGGVCGTFCEVYCDDMATNCADTAFDPDCETVCGAYTDNGTTNDFTGDTVQCRTFHSSAAAFENDAVHCAHAGEDGGNICVAQ